MDVFHFVLELKQEIERLTEESKSDFIRARKEINQVRSPKQHRSSYNLACTPFNSIMENQRYRHFLFFQY